MKKITPEQLAKQLQSKKTTIVDVRSAEKFLLNHLQHDHAKTLNVPKTTIFNSEKSGEQLDVPFSKEAEIVITCTTGNSATRCAHILADKGYNVRVLEGGMTAWNQVKE